MHSTIIKLISNNEFSIKTCIPEELHTKLSLNDGDTDHAKTLSGVLAVAPPHILTV